MKVQCPKCKATYNVDEKKIPDDGINVKCQKCQNQFFIKKEIESVANYLLDKEEKDKTDSTKTVKLKECPRCNLPQEGMDECQYCGFDFRNPKTKLGESNKDHEKIENGQKKPLNFTEGLNRIAMVLAFISLLPGFFIGMSIHYEYFAEISPVYNRTLAILLGILFAAMLFPAVYWGVRGSIKGVKSLSVWLIQGFKEDKK